MSTAQNATEQRLLAAAMSRLELLKRQSSFDPYKLESRPTAMQQEVIDDFGRVRIQWIVAGNQSGKSQTCCRLITWMLTGTHPTWTKPVEWGEEPLLALVCGRTGKQIEESLLPKITAYLTPGTYKEVRVGNIIQRLELDGGNRIVFQSLENPNLARERIQSYVAHVAMVDEMPATSFIIDELLRRVQSRSGYFLASFTPLVINDQIRRMVDAASLPHAKKYQFHMFDNPVYASEDKQLEVLTSMATLPEHVRNTRLKGDWSLNDDAVYYFDWDQMVRMPEDYSNSWRHVLSVDPALKSALGLTLWAEDPVTASWYCIMAEYVKGIYVPTDLVNHVERMVEGRNIVRRISDPHETWYIQTASSMRRTYMGVYKKHERKGELIKGLQEKLGVRVFLTPACGDFSTELQECRWSDKAEGKIINASSYHILDSAQYFCDNIPKAEQVVQASSHQEWLYMANEKRKVKEDKARKKSEAVRIRKKKRWN